MIWTFYHDMNAHPPGMIMSQACHASLSAVWYDHAMIKDELLDIFLINIASFTVLFVTKSKYEKTNLWISSFSLVDSEFFFIFSYNFTPPPSRAFKEHPDVVEYMAQPVGTLSKVGGGQLGISW